MLNTSLTALLAVILIGTLLAMPILWMFGLL